MRMHNPLAPAAATLEIKEVTAGVILSSNILLLLQRMHRRDQDRPRHAWSTGLAAAAEV